MASKITGGCLCGAVRYESAAVPAFAGNCHCRDCQKASGGAYVPLLALPANAVTISGEVKFFDVQGDSGNIMSRGFCPTCGTRVVGKSSGMQALTVILAGTLDDPSDFKPAIDFYTASAQPWDHMNPALPKFPKSPA